MSDAQKPRPTRPLPKPVGLTRQALAILGLLILLTTLAWTSPFQTQPTPSPTNSTSGQIVATTAPNLLATPSATPLPEEWLQSYRNTNEVVLVGVLLVLIVVIGTFSAVRRANRKGPVH
jgi:hypothetical protein